ncbi:hypothetical protein ACFCYI_11500 [Streptomyces sp. NPDC056257]|uniref:hypothetical protein n=1 Tax=Streptomyces sp. NPDC056257 TaxID=3345765 RepID=UPI0035D6C039
MTGFSSTGDSRVAYAKSCVVYDASGKIVHVHHVVDMEGVDETPESTVVERALALVKDEGLDPAELETLLVDPSLFDKPSHLRVDPKGRTVISEEIQNLG